VRTKRGSNDLAAKEGRKNHRHPEKGGEEGIGSLRGLKIFFWKRKKKIRKITCSSRQGESRIPGKLFNINLRKPVGATAATGGYQNIRAEVETLAVESGGNLCETVQSGMTFSKAGKEKF